MPGRAQQAPSIRGAGCTTVSWHDACVSAQGGVQKEVVVVVVFPVAALGRNAKQRPGRRLVVTRIFHLAHLLVGGFLALLVVLLHDAHLGFLGDKLLLFDARNRAAFRPAVPVLQIVVDFGPQAEV